MLSCADRPAAWSELVIPAGDRAAVQMFLGPIAETAPVAEGFVVSGIETTHTTIRINVTNPSDHRTASVELLAPGTAPAGNARVPMRPSADMPPIVLAALTHMLDRPSPPPWVEQQVGPSQAPGYWARFADVLKIGPREPETGQELQRVATLLTVVLLIVSTALLLFRLPRPPTLVFAALLGVTALGFVLRLMLSPHSFMHEYYHVNETIPFIFQSTDGGEYGLTGPMIYRLAHALFGGWEQAVFSTNLVLASLTVPAVVLFDRVLVGRWAHALLAGFIVSVLPVHLRFSASEELWIPGILFSFWSLGAWALWLESAGTLAVSVAVLSLSLAIQTRPELVLLPVAHVGLVLAMKPPRQWLRTIVRCILPGAITGVLVAARIATLLHSPGPTRDVPATPEKYLESIILFMRDVTPRSLVVLLVLGAAWALWKHTRVAALMLALAGLWFLIPVVFYDNRPCIYRTEMFGECLVALVAAGAPFLVDSVSRRWTIAAVALAALAMAQGLWTRRQFVSELLDQQQEVAFLERSVPQLPDRFDLFAYFGPYLSESRPRFLGAFPFFLARRAQKDVEPIEASELGVHLGWPEPRPGLLFYQGMYCYVAREPEMLVDGMTQPCRDIRAHYTLRPVAVTTLETRGYSEAAYAPGPFDVGFFEVTGVVGRR